MRKKKNLLIRERKLRSENAKRNMSRINKRTYYGVGVEMKGYQAEIMDIFYNEDLFKELVSDRATESLEDFFADFQNEVRQNWAEIKERIQDYFLESHEKGGRRVFDEDGEPIEAPKDREGDTRAVQFLVNQQEAHFETLTQQQSQKALEVINNGVQSGQTNDEIVESMQGEIKNLTKSKANVIARTEIVKAHNLGQVELMKDLGADTYNYITSQDKKVSKICRDWQGPPSRPHTYNVEKAGDSNNPLPVISSHPNCRCSVVVKKFKEEGDS